MFFTFTALLTLNAFAPQMFWDQSKTTRNPASLEEDRLEELAAKQAPLKPLEEVKITEDRKVVTVIAEVAQAQCQKDKSTVLEDEIKKLVSDKESILKEIEELKKAKKEDAPKETAKADKKKEKVEVIDVMSQLTSLMISQQAQQQMMMEQMFSMMAMPQMRQQRQFSLNDYMPFASHYEDYSLYSATPRYPKSQSTIGISYPNYNAHDYSNPYSLYDMNNRFPSSDEGMGLQPRYNNPSAYVAPVQQPHSGFNFSNGNDMQRIQF